MINDRKVYIKMWGAVLKKLQSWLRIRFVVSSVVLLTLIGFSGIAVADYVIGADDALKIKVYGHEDMTTETRVSVNGHITIPLIGDIDVGGMSTLEAERKIEQELKYGGYIRDARVTVTVAEYKSQEVSVLGGVNKPGLYPLESQSTLLNVIAMAGGINPGGGTDPGGDNRAIITHHENGKIIKYEVNLTTALEFPEKSTLPHLEKGDVIFIPKPPMFYIQGEVQKPGAYRLDPGITVSHALSLGGGLTLRGSLHGVVIRRREADGSLKTIDAELTDIVSKDDVLIFDERLF
jgi:polysaccharide export outer membrane protein